ncbi:MAG: hypothetical protein KBD29_00470 [Candidatus Magasanikbacteria bacterium]|nr:hypothetical protein [Candidatus Magasanikbacteria bacterium]
MTLKSPISKERKQEIREAFLTWYEKQEDKTGAMHRITADPDKVYYFRRGTLIPQPMHLYHLYEETGDDAFLFTKEEKDRTLRSNWRIKEIPSREEWPDRDDITRKSNLEKEMQRLRREIRAVTKSIQAFGRLSEDDPKRDQARSRLIGPTMELFQELHRLNLKFPSAFEDLLKQMAFASKLTNPHK